jgi:transcriptional regulator with XRE-family HTH domain
MGITQSDLAKGSGITFQQVQKYERGTNRISASRLEEFSQKLQVPISFFFDDGEGSDMTPRGNLASIDFVGKYLATPDALALTDSYMRINNKRLRRSIVELVKHLASFS